MRYDTAFVSARRAEIQARMEAAWQSADPAVRADRVRLVAVTKYLDAVEMTGLRTAGLELFAENRVQAALAKLEACDGWDPGARPLEWHFIGNVQGNKVRAVTGRFHLLHGVDRWDLAQALSREAVSRGLEQRVLLEVHISGEATKHGFGTDELAALWPELSALPGLRVEGLMGMAGLDGDARVQFRGLRRLRDQLDPRRDRLRELSMGMSGDFEEAILEGASLVRIGTSLFSEEAGT
jgi:pyridoxal phosphate enzyme (YggS family)